MTLRQPAYSASYSFEETIKVSHKGCPAFVTPVQLRIRVTFAKYKANSFLADKS